MLFRQYSWEWDPRDRGSRLTIFNVTTTSSGVYCFGVMGEEADVRKAEFGAGYLKVSQPEDAKIMFPSIVILSTDAVWSLLLLVVMVCLKIFSRLRNFSLFFFQVFLTVRLKQREVKLAKVIKQKQKLLNAVAAEPESPNDSNGSNQNRPLMATPTGNSSIHQGLRQSPQIGLQNESFDQSSDSSIPELEPPMADSVQVHSSSTNTDGNVTVATTESSTLDDNNDDYVGRIDSF